MDAHMASAFFDGGVMLIGIYFGAQPAKRVEMLLETGKTGLLRLWAASR